MVDLNIMWCTLHAGEMTSTVIFNKYSFVLDCNYIIECQMDEICCGVT